ncbi:unnamed protein product [Dovyalis caffra]|uniref:Uncharacterized protein n=1 Tax=Dovyalis caffra TaxID=77055 RepID=A0AAV1SJ72_9ROSI|nr:unnamed protein product [Dovyalis caffra]
MVKYYRSKAASEESKTVSADLAAASIQTPANQQAADVAKHPERLSSKELFFQNIDYALDLYLIYVLAYRFSWGSWNTSWAHAPLMVSMRHTHPLFPWLELESRKGLVTACLSRFLLVPAFYFTAKYGDQGRMIFLVSFLGLTNGYLTVCVLTIVPRGYKGPEANALDNLPVLCLLGGIFSGVVLDWLWLIGRKKAF